MRYLAFDAKAQISRRKRRPRAQHTAGTPPADQREAKPNAAQTRYAIRLHNTPHEASPLRS
eukprot:9475999-Pyramimonas_sp.AAC.1